MALEWLFRSASCFGGRRDYKVRFADHDLHHVAWQEYDGSGIFQTRVKVYNGNDAAPQWLSVDGNGAEGLNRSSSFDVQGVRLAVSNCQLYATWFENNVPGKSQIRVAVYNGNDLAPQWTFVDGGNLSSGINRFAALNARNPSLVSFNGLLSVLWEENKGGGVYQIRFAQGQ